MTTPKSIQHLHNIKIYDEWSTPNAILRSGLMLIDENIFLDVCATQQNAKFSKYFTKQDDALKQEWNTNFYMNPPYSEIFEWMEYATQQVKKYKVVGLILTFAKTDTRWWHEFVEGKCKVYFIKGRIRFVKDSIQSKKDAPYPSCWIVMRP
jgi:site-specific DNA-methyltransferase (adenine-specific)